MLCLKISVLIFLLSISTSLGDSSDDQRGYTIVLEGMEVDEEAQKMVENCNIGLTTYNETTNIISGTCDYKGIPTTAWVIKIFSEIQPFVHKW